MSLHNDRALQLLLNVIEEAKVSLAEVGEGTLQAGIINLTTHSKQDAEHYFTCEIGVLSVARSKQGVE